MPMNRHVPAAGIADTQELFCLVLGCNSWNDKVIFASDAQRRACWELRRQEILARVEPGDRPAAWWEYDAPVPRDRTIPEALQLFRLGQLAGGELARVIAIWRKYEKTALGLLKKHGKRDYHQFRRWAGIPDEVVPPAVSTAI